MSLEAGRVGVRPDQLDKYGRINPNSQFIQNLLNDLPVWTDLPVWVDGTEQLLPVNDDEPETSPIKCDITYPIADEKTGQYFTYRESPTQKDGLAKIRGIKGNTLVWNQLVQNGNFASTSNWALSGPVTFTVSNNKATVVCQQRQGIYQQISAIASHKYLLIATCKQNGTTTVQMILREKDSTQATLTGTSENITNTENTLYITKIAEANTAYIQVIFQSNAVDEKTIEIKNVMLFDLTAMGLDVTADQFRALFPLSYYAYNSGSLLSFNGTGIKTVGFNQWDEEWEIGSINNTTGVPYPAGTNRIRSKNFIPCLSNTSYCLYNGSNIQSYAYFYDGSQNYLGMSQLEDVNPRIFTTPTNCCYMKIRTNDTTSSTYQNNICLNISNTSKNGTYEPYTESTTSLPALTYFPTGMKSAGTVYDELTPTRAITRVGAVDLGSLSWYYTSGGQGRFASAGLKTLVKAVEDNTKIANIQTTKYITISAGSVYNGTVGIAIDNTGDIWVYDSYYGTDATAFKTAMSGVMLNYELAVEDVQPTMSFGD